MEETILHKYLLIKNPSKSAYLFSPIMVELLHLVAEVPREVLAKTRIFPRSPGRYIPFYSAYKGGGAITLGSDTWQSITFTENFFSTDNDLFRGRAYANNFYTWLHLAAHEAGHLLHANRFKFILVYLLVFAYQYLKFGHDAAPLEIEAELGNTRLKQFRAYLTSQEGPHFLKELITSERDSKEKIQQLNYLWIEYQATISNPNQA